MGLFKRGGSLLKCPDGSLAATCYCTDRPAIELTGSLAWFIETGGAGSTLPAALTNVGGPGTILTWLATLVLNGSLAGKITAAPVAGELGDYESEDIFCTLDASGLSAGTYTGSLTVEETVVSGVSSKSLPISVKVAAGYTGGLWVKLTDTDPDHTVFSQSVFEMPYQGVSKRPDIYGVTDIPIGTSFRHWYTGIIGGTLYYFRFMYFYTLGRFKIVFGTKAGVPFAVIVTEVTCDLDPADGSPMGAGSANRYNYPATGSGTQGTLFTIQRDPFT